MHVAFHPKIWTGAVLLVSIALIFAVHPHLLSIPDSSTLSQPSTKLATLNEYEALNLLTEIQTASSMNRLRAIAKRYKTQYRNAKPFPHIVLDDLFPDSIVKALEKEIPEAEGCFDPSKCKDFRNAKLKSYIDREEDMGTITRLVMGVLKSSNWIAFLQELTSVNSLIPDPHYEGSGVHITSRGGFLQLHADFNRLTKYQLDRRVNTFLFLNPDWKESYGGHLELWSIDLQHCFQRILPISGRFVVFSTTDFSYHGHPEHLECPSGRSRRSIAMYYYTNGRPDNECLNNDCSATNDHSTLYKKPSGCRQCVEETCKAYDEDFVVPSV